MQRILEKVPSKILGEEWRKKGHLSLSIASPRTSVKPKTTYILLAIWHPTSSHIVFIIMTVTSCAGRKTVCHWTWPLKASCEDNFRKDSTKTSARINENQCAVWTEPQPFGVADNFHLSIYIYTFYRLGLGQNNPEVYTLQKSPKSQNNPHSSSKIIKWIQMEGFPKPNGGIPNYSFFGDFST